MNVARGGGAADPAAAKAQLDASFRKIKKPKIDLIQVHNLGDVPTQLKLLKDLKAQGRVRYFGVTTTSSNQYNDLIRNMKAEPLDFIGVNYAIDDRDVEQTILPLARDRKIAVLAYAPFGRTRLFRRVQGQSLPGWAAELDAKTWAQFFLKFVAAKEIRRRMEAQRSPMAKYSPIARCRPTPTSDRNASDAQVETS